MEEVEITEIYCDFCKEETVVNYAHSGHRGCVICERDGCKKHLVLDDYDGDYCDAYCESCWEIGKEYREKIKEEEEAFDRKIKKLNEGWREKAIIKNEIVKKSH